MIKDNNLIYGFHSLYELLSSKPNLVLEIFLNREKDDPRRAQLENLAKEHTIPIHLINKKQLEIWFPNLNHQGIAAKIKLPDALNEHHLETFLTDFFPKKYHKNPLLLILDGVQDPHNLGACLRSADAAQVSAVIIPKDNSAPLTPTVRKVSSGAIDNIPIFQINNLARVLKKLKEHGIWLMGAAGGVNSNLYEMDLKVPTGIIMGAEQNGLRRLTKEHCDYLFSIPMLGQVESLNVSVATGIVLYEALRQRLNSA
ncbi:MAG: rRNA (guanosine-2-O-) -methyltransferase rlmB [Francisellaceae bacterium]|nr:rRNA (guanosine-2-O-) -methyltransferase rlmB [Francisellaceae bacterium]